MSYKLLGSRGPITGKADTSGMNSGNWTIAFTPDILSVTVSQFEVYKIVVHGASGSQFDVVIENKQWDNSVFGQDNAWDPNQPMVMIPGQTLYFLYSDPTTDNTPPNATIWLRYDPEVGF